MIISQTPNAVCATPRPAPSQQQPPPPPPPPPPLQSGGTPAAPAPVPELKLVRLELAVGAPLSPSRKTRSLSVDFKSVAERRDGFAIEGVSCKAVKSAVKHLYSLEDFNIDEKPIGCGFYAFVYRVTHKVTKQEMVLKMNNMSSMRDALIEIETLNALQHPNILKFHGVCVHEGKLWCLTEFVRGGSLDQLLARFEVPLTWHQRTKMALDIASGMSYLHSQAICHRDLTSKNILFRHETNGDYTCIVADFGLSLNMKKHASQLETRYMATPYWMAPECLNGRVYSEKADVFSYAIVLCEIITRLPGDTQVPRRNDFSLDAPLLRSLTPPDCPPALLSLAISCADLEAPRRPPFSSTAPLLRDLLDDLACAPPEWLTQPPPARCPGRTRPVLESKRRLRSVTEAALRKDAAPLLLDRRRSIGAPCLESLRLAPVERAPQNGERRAVIFLDFYADPTARRRHLPHTLSLPDLR